MSDSKKDALIIQLLEKIDEKQDQQSEQLTEIRIQAAEQKSALEAHAKQDEVMYGHLREIDSRLEEYNSQLATHIAGVQELRKMNTILKQDLDDRTDYIGKRIDKLEEPRKLVGVAKKIVVEIGAVAVATSAIWAFLKLVFPRL